MFEVVERKGLGDPDTLSDRGRREFGRRLAALMTLDKVAHSNVDKEQLVGGAVEVGYGGGRVARRRTAAAGRTRRPGVAGRRRSVRARGPR